MKAARWAYQKAHWANFEQEGSYNLPSVFHQMAISTNLLSTKIYEVQETWGGQKDLRATHQRSWASRASIPLRPWDDEVAWPSAPGVAKSVRMREQWWITYELCTTTLASSMPTAWTTSPPMQRPCITMSMFANHNYWHWWWWWWWQSGRQLWGWWQWWGGGWGWWIWVWRGLPPSITSTSVFMPGQVILTKLFCQHYY